MQKRGTRRSLLSICGLLRLAALGCAALLFARGAHAAGPEYPWVVLTPADDSRSAHMRAWDEAESLNTVSVINLKEGMFEHRFVWKRAAIKDLLSMDAPFCELRFDAVYPFRWSPGERTILAEYLKRGGFIVFMMDAYPYSQDEFWAVREWPVIDFVTKELPGADRGFSTRKGTEDMPIFRSPKLVHTHEWIQIELAGNPNTVDRTMLFYQGRLCGFVLGEYSYRLWRKGGWVGFTRDPPVFYTFGEHSIDLLVNLYVSSMTR